MPEIVTHSAAETVSWGERLGMLAASGDFFALMGDLGAGKTQFVQGMAVGLGVESGTPVTSPTFTLVNIYGGRLPFYHLDLYRLAGAEEVAGLGLEEYLFGSGVCVVEWAERLGPELPTEHLIIRFTMVGEHERSLVFEPAGLRYRKLVEELFAGGEKKF